MRHITTVKLIVLICPLDKQNAQKGQKYCQIQDEKESPKSGKDWNKEVSVYYQELETPLTNEQIFLYRPFN